MDDALDTPTAEAPAQVSEPAGAAPDAAGANRL
jgi:hypothetical protein